MIKLSTGEYNIMQYLHEQIYKTLKKKILNSEYKPGDMLPKEMELIEVYNCSRHTLRKAMDRLFNEGYIYKIKGTGTFVKAFKAAYNLSNMASFSEIIDSQEGKANSIVYQAKLVIPDPDICHKLGLKESESCYYIERVRRNLDLNLCFEKTYINPKLCPDIINYMTPNASLYDLYINKYNLKLSEGLYDLEATNATEEVAKVLDIKVGSAILLMYANIYLENGTPLYYVEAHYVGSRYTFKTKLKR